jgi:hypothetical protein
MTTGRSPASCGSSGPATLPISSVNGFLRWTGVVDKLRAGASVADAGCGLGA